MKENKEQFHFLPFLLGIALIAFLIQAGGVLQGNRIVFPDIREIGEALFRLLGQGNTYVAAGFTLLHLLEALALSVCIGTALGLAESMNSRFRSLLIPLMTLIRSLPMIVLVILIMTAAVYQVVPVLTTTMVLIPLISEAVYEGVRSIEPELKDVYRLNSGFSAAVLFHVYIPLISGYLKQSFFNAAGMGLKVTVTAEYLVQARNSLGKAVYSSSYFLEYSEIYAYAVIMILIVLLLTELPVWILKRIEERNARKSSEIIA